MRYLDIAMAALVGVTAITGVLVWNPSQGDASAHAYQTASALRSGIYRFIEEKGSDWFLVSPSASVCGALAADSSSTFSLGGEVGTLRCGWPPAGAVSAELAFRVSHEEVTLVAWSDAGA